MFDGRRDGALTAYLPHMPHLLQQLLLGCFLHYLYVFVVVIFLRTGTSTVFSCDVLAFQTDAFQLLAAA